jgi:hypothetical protein
MYFNHIVIKPFMKGPRDKNDLHMNDDIDMDNKVLEIK